MENILSMTKKYVNSLGNKFDGSDTIVQIGSTYNSI